MSLFHRRSVAAHLMGSLVLAAGLVTLASTAYAQDRGSKAEAKALADAALAHIGKVGFEPALKDFVADKARWVQKDLYVVVFNYQGQCLAHGANEKLIGKSMWDVKDQSGKPFVQLFVTAAKEKAEGWVDFDWVHPQTKKPEPKTMNTRRVPGQDAVLVVGYYRG